MLYTPRIGTLGYVMRDGQVLMVHRTRPGDEQEGMWNGLGGKIEEFEDPVTGMIRELREEAGITATKVELRGTINWPGFGHGCDYYGTFGFVFLITAWEGDVADRSPEGPLSWHPVEEILQLNLYEGDRIFLPYVFDGDPRQFHMVIPYDDFVLQADKVSIVR